MTTGVPQLSVVLATDCYETIRLVVARLRLQTVAPRVEVIVVCPSLDRLNVDEQQLRGFANVQTIEVKSIETLAAARSAGVRAAQAPIVFIGETHSFPHRGWAEALIAAHEEDWAAVVPGIANANPENAISWANLLSDYGSWLCVLPRHVTSRVPTWNTAYKRDLLIAFGGELESLLTYGDAMQVRLLSEGHRFLFEPAAVLDHVNIARVRPWLRERYLGGLLISSTRMTGWSVWRRLVYVCGSPLIPFVTLGRSFPAIREVRRATRLPFLTYPVMAIGIVVSAVGEMVGYAAGANARSGAAMTEFEVHKVPHSSLSAG